MPNLTRTVTDTQRAMLAEMADAPTQRATWTADPSGYGVRGWYTVATDGHRYSTRTADALVDAGMAEYADHGATIYLTRDGATYLATLADADAEVADAVAEGTVAEVTAELDAVATRLAETGKVAVMPNINVHYDEHTDSMTVYDGHVALVSYSECRSYRDAVDMAAEDGFIPDDTVWDDSYPDTHAAAVALDGGA